ncbi:MAG: Dps family protein [Hyphomicrobiaceae bacterium]
MSNASPRAVAKPVALDTGIAKKDRSTVASELVDVLADTYTLLVKTHVYHWNVVGPLFIPFHELTEAHYKNLFEAADVIAERIRSLGHPAPLGFAELLPKSAVEEETSKRSAEGMVTHLIADHEKMVKRLRQAAIAADEVDDLVTADLLTQRLAFHEKAIWMLRAIVGQG